MREGFELLHAATRNMPEYEPADYSELYDDELADMGMKIIDRWYNREWFSKGASVR